MQSLWQYFRTFTVPSFATTGARIVLDGISGTELVYDTSNHLIASISPNGGTDAAGNTYLPGISTYDPASTAKFLNMFAGVLELGTMTGTVPNTAASSALFAAAGQLNLYSGQNVSPTTDQAVILMQAGQPNEKTGSFINPSISIGDTSLNSAVDVSLSGAVYKTDDTGTYLGWQVPTAAGGYTVSTLQYRIDAEDNVHWSGEIVQATGVAGAGGATVIAAVPVGYRPTKTWVVPGAWISTTSVSKGAVTFFVNSSGTLVVGWPSTTANGDKFSIQAKIPLGNLS